MEIVILLSLFIAWRISKRHTRPQKRRKAAPGSRAAPPSKTAIEREERRQQRQRIAAIEYEHCEALAAQYKTQAAEIEKALEEETGQKIRQKLRKQLDALDEKTYKTDLRKAKAFDIMSI